VTQADPAFQKLQSDIEAIEAKSQVTVGELTAFGADLQAINPTPGQTTKGFATAWQTLQSDGSAVLSSGTFTAAQQAQIVNDFAGLLTSIGATQAQAAQASADLKTIITASGITASDIARIQGDSQAIQAQLGTSGSTANPGSTTSSPAQPDPIDLVGPVLAAIVMGRVPAGPMGLGLGSGPLIPPMGVLPPVVVARTGGSPVMPGGSPSMSMPLPLPIIPTTTASPPAMPGGLPSVQTPTATTPAMPSGFPATAWGVFTSTDPVILPSVPPSPNNPPSSGGAGSTSTTHS
jgi:hypothetical protein